MHILLQCVKRHLDRRDTNNLPQPLSVLKGKQSQWQIKANEFNLKTAVSDGKA